MASATFSLSTEAKLTSPNLRNVKTQLRNAAPTRAFVRTHSNFQSTFRLNPKCASRQQNKTRTMSRSPPALHAVIAPQVLAAAKDPKETTVLVVGATGYIGKFVTKELVARGYNVVAVAREKSGVGGKKSPGDVERECEGARVVLGNVQDKDSTEAAFAAAGGKVDVVVSCMASRTGGIKDSWDIDYLATKNVLDVAKAAGVSQFVLLSAICAQKPLLTFQKAKLQFEEYLKASGMTYSIVRPTAFFKSLGGQVTSVQGGGPYVMFGDGQLAACKPISERDLASYMADCIEDPTLQNQMLPIGGPGEAMTALQQGQMLFKLLEKEEKFIKVPIEIMTGAIKVFDVLASVFGGLTDAAEFAKIGKYYAAESMLVLDTETNEYRADLTPSYGNDTLEGFFKKCIEEGMDGQELGDAAVFGQK
eukprot:CAMPEP_0196579952 /NCGR_PEP_ID=MMETSP1081-20130531/25910_1 /TAXON_ID=36882 /ORGANISM="Pyramimonas amylifera, Strain CCMP720" /LENGTH=419 /DNA_ID=CAMNT_0041899685 /DNA_START=50 /DNA_END=1309 /DNA_ORIENTATION=-